ncbi:MAG: tRNA (adenosine(37)-N6)-threonylcarbamoyltransferase complex ATPase subunit type 1 TsaE [Phycisphaerae bacterium]|nr:tRNA (adenosine(37)-N6)-threonylcarbamoyltransferase complex ATPase subunit type 1 TsaE [Phycisphaerae bacterium]
MANEPVGRFDAPLIARIETSSVDETIALGRRLGAVLRAGDVIALVGRLGAGKTHFAKGLALGLGVRDPRAVNSPTFVLVNEYEGRLPIHHIDAYRLTSSDELAAIGFEEMLTQGAIVIIEWADRVGDAMPRHALWIEFDTPGETARSISLRAAESELATRLLSAGLTGASEEAITDSQRGA